MDTGGTRRPPGRACAVVEGKERLPAEDCTGKSCLPVLPSVRSGTESEPPLLPAAPPRGPGAASVLASAAAVCCSPGRRSARRPGGRRPGLLCHGGGRTLEHCQSGLLPPRALLSCIDHLLSRSRSVYTFRQRSHAGALQAAPGFVSRTRGRRGAWLTVPGPPVRQRRTPPGPGNPTDSDADRTLRAAFQKPV